MASMAPPPPPAGGFLPPPPMPGGGMPLQLAVPPPPSGGPGGPGNGPPPRIPFTATILLTNVPPFLHTFRALRDWMYPCGSVRNAIFYPRSKTKEDEKNDVMSSSTDANDKIKKVTSILITMSHPDGACKFLGSFKQFTSRLDERYNQIQAYMVPASPDVPLPPPFLDEDSQQHLGEKLWQNLISLENPEEDCTQEMEAPKTLDVTKVAAAAGGGNYDADEDPLNAPQVLEAVKEFRRKLEQTQSLQKKKRMELVTQKLDELRPRVQAMMVEEKQRGPPPPPPMMGGGGPMGGPGCAPPLPGGLPPPLPVPLPSGALPPPPMPSAAAGGLPAPSMPTAEGAAAADSGKRGRSNLPAWMTQQKLQEEQAAAAAEEPAAKKAKTTATEAGPHPTHFPATLPPSTHAALREYLSKQVEASLGEAEATLIDFLHSHILQGKATTELQQELQIVLEEEAPAFLEALWKKVYELQGQG